MYYKLLFSRGLYLVLSNFLWAKCYLEDKKVVIGSNICNTFRKSRFGSCNSVHFSFFHVFPIVDLQYFGCLLLIFENLINWFCSLKKRARPLVHSDSRVCADQSGLVHTLNAVPCTFSYPCAWVSANTNLSEMSLDPHQLCFCWNTQCLVSGL